MWKINAVKSTGRQTMKRNFTPCLIVSLIMVLLISGPLSITDTMDKYIDYIQKFGNITGSEKVVQFSKDIKEFESKFRQNTTVGEESSKGFISGLYHSSKKTGTAAGGFLLIIDHLFLKGDISTSVIIGCGVLIALLFAIFVKNILRIGSARFFMENKLDGSPRISSVLYVYKMKKTLHCAWVMFCRVFFIMLWFLTIVGGVIKFYSYRMMPYILAENPETSRQDAFQKSREMMKGNKFRVFLLDVSFIPWWILSVITFGIVQYLYLEPYMRSAYAELYFEIKQDAVEMVPIAEDKKELHYDYHRSYSIYNLVLIFFVFATFGWVWECILQIIETGYFVNRGSLYGPWVPIYGFGGVALVVLLKRFADRPIVTFFLAMLVCGILEGGTGWYLDAVKGMRYWDYSNFYFNIHGYVCLEGLLVFGLGGCMFIYLLAPMLDTYFNKIPKKGRITMCVILVSAFLTDTVYAHFNPHTGEGIGGYIDDSTGGSDAL